MTRLWVLGGVIVALTMLALSLHQPGALSVGTIQMKTWWVVIAGASAGVYLVAVWLVTARADYAQGLWVVLLIAVALRLPLVFAPPFLSTDVYRYVWDGRVQAAGINPYRYMPADPELISLRDTTVYPYINRAEYAPTIYPPAAQVVFGFAGLIWSNVVTVKATMVGFEALAVFCLLRLLKAANLPAQRVLIYAWNPLPVWAFSGNGHVDAVAIGLLALTLLLWVQKRSGWAGVALGAMILTKFLPAVVAPVLWRRGTGWRTVLGAVVTIVLLYGLYSSAGSRIFGFLSGYDSEEGYASGTGFWLLAGIGQAVNLPGWAVIIYKLVVAAILAGFGAWYAFVVRPADPVALCAAAGTMMALLIFAISPHYPWYFAWLAVPCVLAPSPALLWLATAPILLYLDTFGDRFFWPSVVYAPAIALLLARFRPVSHRDPIEGML